MTAKGSKRIPPIVGRALLGWRTRFSDGRALVRLLFALSFGSMAARLDIRVYREDDEDSVVLLWNDNGRLRRSPRQAVHRRSSLGHEAVVAFYERLGHGV